jgi:phosphatidylserine decarboxylase
MGITLYNRERKSLETENVAAGAFLNFIYRTKPGLLLTEKILKKKYFSILYGNLLKKPSSRKKITAFIKQHQIDPNEFENNLNSFKSFNDFFIRKLKTSARPVEQTKDIFISPADSRLMVIQIKEETIIPVKGKKFTLFELIEDKNLTDKYINGLCLVFRLAPPDYHRFCYIDNGIQQPVKALGNYYHSVNPVALASNLPVFEGNYREYCELHTENFGEILDIDVGAMGVSKIIQNFPNGCKFNKGQEKGYFEFGGSTTILILKPGIVKIDEDILNYSEQGIETLVKFGSGIGRKL